MKRHYAVERILDHFPRLDCGVVSSRLWYSTFVNFEKRFMYFEVPKAGCTEIKYLLRRLEGAGAVDRPVHPWSYVTRRDLLVHDRPSVPLPSLVDLDNSQQREILESPDFLRMTVVRNPYTRLVSAWRNKVVLCEGLSGREVYLKLRGRLPAIYEKSPVSFDEFAHYALGQLDHLRCDSHWMRQVDHTFFPAMNFSFVGKVECFNEVLRRIEQHLGLSESLATEGRKNESLQLGVASYAESLAAKVYSWYRSDFETFRYDRESWKALDQQHPDGQLNYITLSQERLRNEIIERNLVVLALYEECDRFRARLRRFSWLHLDSAVNGLAALHRKFRRFI